VDSEEHCYATGYQYLLTAFGKVKALPRVWSARGSTWQDSHEVDILFFVASPSSRRVGRERPDKE